MLPADEMAKRTNWTAGSQHYIRICEVGGLGRTNRQRCMSRDTLVSGIPSRAENRQQTLSASDSPTWLGMACIAGMDGMAHINFLSSGAWQGSAVLEVDEQSESRSAHTGTQPANRQACWPYPLRQVSQQLRHTTTPGVRGLTKRSLSHPAPRRATSHRRCG